MHEAAVGIPLIIRAVWLKDATLRISRDTRCDPWEFFHEPVNYSVPGGNTILGRQYVQ